jgi:hypothetical protein
MVILQSIFTFAEIGQSADQTVKDPESAQAQEAA